MFFHSLVQLTEGQSSSGFLLLGGKKSEFCRISSFLFSRRTCNMIVVLVVTVLRGSVSL